MQLKSPSSTKSFVQTPTPIEDPTDFQLVSPIQSDFQSQEYSLKAREQCLAEFENLQREVEDLHLMFNQLSTEVHTQGEQIEVVTENVEETQVNVIEGERQLHKALKYKKAMYPVCGALIGTCVGGPIGFIAGLKAGGLAAIGCGILGFTGGTVLKKNEETRSPNASSPPSPGIPASPSRGNLKED